MDILSDGDVWVLREEALRSLIGRPGFAQASLAAAATLADLHRESWVLNRLINDRGRLAAALTMLDLHFSGGACGFAVSDLREQAQIHGFGSPNRAAALVGALRVVGFLAPVEAADSRLRKVAPTEQYLALFRRRFVLQLEAQALTHPQIGGAIAALAEPSFLGAFLHGELTLTRLAARTGTDPGIDALAERANAMVMLYAIFVAEAGGALLPIAELARRFAVARSHVLSVMKEAEAYGLMVLDPVARNFRPTERLRWALHRVFAGIFLTHAKAYEDALATSSEAIAL